MANKGDKWFYLGRPAKKYDQQNDVIRLRPRLVGEPDKPRHQLNVTGDTRFPFTTRARILVDTAAALSPKDEKSFFKVKGAAHIGRAFELLADIGQPTTATNAYDLLTSEKVSHSALEKLAELDPTDGDEFQNAITASHDGTSNFNVIDGLRDCMLMRIVSAQAFESLILPRGRNWPKSWR
jgi:hypothetical protein